MKKLLREPAFHFLLIGCLLFVLATRIRRSTDSADRHIVVSSSQIKALATGFEQTWMRAPTDTELTALTDSYIRDEVYQREALGLGFDQNDPVIRRRMRQKLELLLDDMASVVVPSDQVLATFMQEQPERFRKEPQVSFQHVYLNPDKRPDLKRDAEAMLLKLQAGEPAADVGDPILLSREFKQATQSEIERQFGGVFARQVVALQPGTWQGPISSGLGGHLVYVSERVEGRLPELAEVRSDVEREWINLRRKERKQAAYQKLLERYEVVVEREEGDRK